MCLDNHLNGVLQAKKLVDWEETSACAMEELLGAGDVCESSCRDCQRHRELDKRQDGIPCKRKEPFQDVCKEQDEQLRTEVRRLIDHDVSLNV